MYSSTYNIENKYMSYVLTWVPYVAPQVFIYRKSHILGNP